MASGYSTGRGRSTMNSTIDRKISSHDREDSTTLNQLTRNVVDDFKRSIQNKINQNINIDKSVVESEVSIVRRRLLRDQCRISVWKGSLPQEIADCPDEIIISAIAYGNNPTEVKSIIQEKMNQSNTTNGSLNKILGPLRTLKTDLSRSQPVNILQDVKNINDDQIERANRLFLSEALHFAPGVKGEFHYQNAAATVEGIRESDGQSIDEHSLLAIIKTARSAEDVRDIIEQASKKPKRQDNSKIKSSRFDNDDDDDNNDQQSNKWNRQMNSTTQNSRFADNDRDTLQQQSQKTTKQTSSFGQSSRFDEDDDDDRNSRNQQSNKPIKPVNSSAQSSRFDDDNRSNTSSPRTSNVSNSNFSFKPLETPSFSPSNTKPTTTTSRRFDNSSDEESPSKPSPMQPPKRR